MNIQNTVSLSAFNTWVSICHLSFTNRHDIQTASLNAFNDTYMEQGDDAQVDDFTENFAGVPHDCLRLLHLLFCINVEKISGDAR